MSVRRRYMTYNQKLFILEKLEADPFLISKPTRNEQYKSKYKRKWQNLTGVLNNVPGGAQKTVTEWQRAWAQLKFSTKSRANTWMLSTDPSKVEIKPLSEFEHRLLNQMNFRSNQESKTELVRNAEGDGSGDDFAPICGSSGPNFELDPLAVPLFPVQKLKFPDKPILYTTQADTNNTVNNESLQRHESDSKRRYLTSDQKQILIANMEVDQHLFSCSGRDVQSKMRYRKKWHRLVDLLNSVEGGPKKTVLEWQKGWAELKFTAKTKAKALEDNIRTNPLSEFEQSVIKLINLRTNQQLKWKPDPEIICQEAGLSMSTNDETMMDIIEIVDDAEDVKDFQKCDISPTSGTTEFDIGFEPDKSLPLPSPILEKLLTAEKVVTSQVNQNKWIAKKAAPQKQVIEERQSTEKSLLERQTLALESISNTLEYWTPIMETIANLTPILKEIATQRNRDAW